MLVIREDNVFRLIDVDTPEFGSPDRWPQFDATWWHLTGGPATWDVMIDILLHEPPHS